MKNPLLIALIFLCLISINTFGQDAKIDKIVKTNGDQLLGTVTKIGEESISFIYQNESLVYEIKKSEINKIQFSSGRIEVFTPVASAADPGLAQTSPSLESHHNQVAVLPFEYMNSGGTRDDKMGLKVQSDCYSFLLKKTRQFSIQDPLTTNALLIKSGLSVDNLIGLTPQEMANLLGVEYVIYGTVVITQSGVYSSSANSYSGKSNGNKYSGINFGSSTSSVDYNTNVDMKIYTDQGQNIYSETHDSFWPSENAYEVTLQYLIKRTPLYSK